MKNNVGNIIHLLKDLKSIKQSRMPTVRADKKGLYDSKFLIHKGIIIGIEECISLLEEELIQ